MQLSTTFRHMDASQAVRDYAEERLEKIRKYFQKGPMAAHAVFSVERGFNHVAELNITLANGLVINAKETTEDMYSSIDLAVARIERQIRRWKDKIRDHKPRTGAVVQVREVVITRETIEPQPAPVDASAAAAPAPQMQIVREENTEAQTMTVDDAVMQLNLLQKELLVFTEVQSGALSVLYRRKDGNYGLVETGRPAVKGS